MAAERKESNILELLQKNRLRSLQQEGTFKHWQRKAALGVWIALHNPELQLMTLSGPVPFP